MATCPTCQHGNPAEVENCARCGQPVAGPPADPTVPGTVRSVRRVITDTPLSAPLPAPMVEPIQTPDSERQPLPAPTSLSRSLRALAEVAPDSAERTPAPVTKVEYSAPLGGGAPVTVRTNSTVAGVGASPAAVVADPTPIPNGIDSPTGIATVRLKLVVLRGQKVAAEYPIYEGRNTIGRFVDKPVDIDLVTQEPVEQVWCSRLHAAITYDRGVALVEDLNSLNGTWVNGARIHPGQHRQLKANDVIQVGTVQMKLVLG